MQCAGRTKKRTRCNSLAVGNSRFCAAHAAQEQVGQAPPPQTPAVQAPGTAKKGESLIFGLNTRHLVVVRTILCCLRVCNLFVLFSGCDRALARDNLCLVRLLHARVSTSQSRFEQGVIMSGPLPPTEWVPREEDERFVKSLVSGQRAAKREFYWLIYGEHGTGKSSLCARICNNTGKGCIYSVVQRGEDFAQDLATAIAFQFDEHINVLSFLKKYLSFQGTGPLKVSSCAHCSPQDKAPSNVSPLGRVLAHIRAVAREYKNKHNSLPVLVIDNINYLSEDELQLFQDVAKGCADEGILRFIFVSSDSWAVSYLQGLSPSLHFLFYLFFKKRPFCW